MSIKIDNVSELEKQIILIIEPADYQGEVNSTLKHMRKTADIPGFRKGNAPMGIITNMYGKSAKARVVYDMMEKKLNNAIKDNQLNIIGQPIMDVDKSTPMDLESDKNYEFVFDVGLIPEFEVNLTDKDKLDCEFIIPTDEDIKKEKESIARRFGEQIDGDVVENNSVLKGDVKYTNSEGEEVEVQDSMFSVDLMKEGSDAVVGKKLEDEITINPVKAFENDREIKYLLQLDQETEDLSAYDKDVTFKITSIKNFKEKEFNEEFYKQLYGEDTEVKTEADLDAKLRENIKELYAPTEEGRFMLTLKNYLLENVNIPLPEDFIKRLMESNDENFNAEKVDADEFKRIFDSFRWNLITDKIYTTYCERIEEPEIVEKMKERINQQFVSYGFGAMPDTMLEEYARKQMENQEELRSVTNSVIQTKIVSWAKANAKIKEIEITTEEFVKKIETENKEAEGKLDTDIEAEVKEKKKDKAEKKEETPKKKKTSPKKDKAETKDTKSEE
ncbi:MAG: trigger factor [Bacteroidales bacterium]